MIAAIVVLFNPSEKQVNQVLATALQFDVTIVVDNSSIPAFSKDECNSFYYVHNGNVGGIAGAFNAGIELCKSLKVQYLCTIDQDTVLPPGFCSDMKTFVEVSGAKVCCPDFLDINSNTSAGFAVLEGIFYLVNRHEYTDFCISSGMFFSIDVFDHLSFDSSLIIDHVDTDICLKLKDCGYKIFINRGVILKHAIGNRSVKRFFFLTVKPTNHSYLRRYYIVRNGWFLALRYFRRYPGYFFLNFYRTVHELLSVILYEQDKFRKIIFMAKGLFHGAVGRLGPL